MKKTMLNLSHTLYNGFTVVNAGTKKAQALKAAAECMSGHRLTHLYKKPSPAKWSAYHYCFDLFCKDSNSTFFAVGRANSMCFSACWYTYVGDYKVLAYITKRNNYIVPLSVRAKTL